ncbi:MAG TPA: Asp-tRNA(Asn)/Glu-tRNA(Gln) amidotransferase subunit GatA [Parcubacteria group bacterium]|nr:Asp-tRNA(Asn)/Glu-tRNA(Gln) amidotransferase subunit GatA [Parcubacteria group bacterium]
MIDLHKLTIKEARENLQKKVFSAKDLALSYLSRIKEVNGDINAYLEVYDDVIKQAEEADKKIANGEDLPLLGIPLAIKDNILVRGKRATSASKILEGFISPYDATVITKLKEAGAIFLGRVNMDEFAMGGSTENSAFGVTKNPLDFTRVPGGSSGGSIAAVAMDGALASLGSDTGGSVREPASFCGVVGLKPTYGGVSRHGLMALGSSLDVIGPITKTATDSETLFNCIKGIDPMDSTTYSEDTYPKAVVKDKMVIGVPYHILNKGGISKEAREVFDNSVDKLKKLGFEIKEIELPNIEYSLAVYYIIMPAEASSNLARFDGVRFGLHKDGDNLLEDYLKTKGEGFGKEVRRRILIGTYVLSAGYHDAYYNKALKLRSKISKDFEKAFKDVDAIITPTTTGVAFKIGEKANDPLSLYLEDIFTVPANIVGIPAISIPSGTISVSEKELPLGLQIMSKHNAENILFHISKKFLGEN